MAEQAGGESESGGHLQAAPQVPPHLSAVHLQAGGQMASRLFQHTDDDYGTRLFDGLLYDVPDPGEAEREAHIGEEEVLVEEAAHPRHQPARSLHPLATLSIGYLQVRPAPTLEPRVKANSFLQYVLLSCSMQGLFTKMFGLEI